MRIVALKVACDPCEETGMFEGHGHVCDDAAEASDARSGCDSTCPAACDYCSGSGIEFIPV